MLYQDNSGNPAWFQDEEKMVEYLKELQAEKESLEASLEKGKTSNAIKLIEQGQGLTIA
jgi:hypothetical protein